MDQKSQERSSQNAVNAMIVCWVTSGIFVLVGGAISWGSISPPTQLYSHEGLLVEATESSRRGHNTTLLIRKGDDSIAKLEVKSSLRVREIPKIRARARAHKGQRVVYYRTRENGGRLVSVRTVGGESIVSAEHTLAAERFTGSAMLIFGLLLGAIGFFLARPRHR